MHTRAPVTLKGHPQLKVPALADTPSIGWKVRGDSLEHTGPYDLLNYARRQFARSEITGNGQHDWWSRNTVSQRVACEFCSRIGV